MSNDKKPKIPDYEGDLYRKEYAPGIVALLRELTNLNEKTFLEFVGTAPIDLKRLSLLLSENLESVAAKTFGVASLSALSFQAMRERAAFPHLYREAR